LKANSNAKIYTIKYNFSWINARRALHLSHYLLWLLCVLSLILSALSFLPHNETLKKTFSLHLETLTHSHTHTHNLSLSLTHTQSLSHTHTQSLSHKHTHSKAPSFFSCRVNNLFLSIWKIDANAVKVIDRQ